jgi:hypothetical protein
MKTILLTTMLLGAIHSEAFTGALSDNLERHEIQTQLDAIEEELPNPFVPRAMGKAGIGLLSAGLVQSALGLYLTMTATGWDIFSALAGVGCLIIGPVAVIAGIALIVTGAVLQHRYNAAAAREQPRINALHQRLDELSRVDGPAPAMVLARF